MHLCLLATEKQQCWSTFLHSLYILSFCFVNLFICWICYHSDCFHSTRSKKWSNILNNGLSFVEEIFRWLKSTEILAEVKNDVKRQMTEIILLPSVYTTVRMLISAVERIFFTIFCWIDLRILVKEKKTKSIAILAVRCKFIVWMKSNTYWNVFPLWNLKVLPCILS